MSRYLTNREGGKTDEVGHVNVLKSAFLGDIISGGAISQSASPGMSVQVTAMKALITDGDARFEIWSDADEDVTVATASPTYARKDALVAYVDKDVTPQTVTANNPAMWLFKVVSGTPAPSPAIPNDATIQSSVGAGNPFIKIGEVAVPQSATLISNANLEAIYNQAVPKDYAGVIKDYAGAVAPAGYLLCYGQAVDRQSYSALFRVIGTTYGVGDGSTTFNVPDARGRVIAGKDNMGGSSANRLTDLSGGLDGDTLGDTGGEEAHTLLLAETPAKTGQITIHNQATATTIGGVSGAFSSGFTATKYFNQGTGTSGAGSVGVINFNNGGGDGAHNNVQPTLILNKIIAY